MKLSTQIRSYSQCAGESTGAYEYTYSPAYQTTWFACAAWRPLLIAKNPHGNSGSRTFANIISVLPDPSTDQGAVIVPNGALGRRLFHLCLLLVSLMYLKQLLLLFYLFVWARIKQFEASVSQKEAF